MLTIQPDFSTLNCRKPCFTANPNKSDDFCEEVFDDDFNIGEEKKAAKQELDLWEGTKKNIEQIAKTTESVPALKKGTDILSGITAVAIGWGGLRWGTVVTLEVLSKAGETAFGKKIKGIGTFVKNQAKNLKTWVSNLSVSRSVANKFSDLKTSFLRTSVGEKCSAIKTAIVENSTYKSTVKWFKSLNPKRVFVESMGVAGGGTAALETMGVHTVDGTVNNVESDDKGNYRINGRQVEFEDKDEFVDVA